jgi:hypothetical protein
LEFPVSTVSRNNGVPPAPPTLAITSTTGSSISLGWTPAPDGGAPLIAYHVHYHREFGDWDRADVSPRNTSFTLTGLRCGTKYQFYLQVPQDRVAIIFLMQHNEAVKNLPNDLLSIYIKWP